MTQTYSSAYICNICYIRLSAIPNEKKNSNGVNDYQKLKWYEDSKQSNENE